MYEGYVHIMGRTVLGGRGRKSFETTRFKPVFFNRVQCTPWGEFQILKGPQSFEWNLVGSEFLF